MSEKIKQTHLDRIAYVYVRQSSMHQVRTHSESRRRQYALVNYAREKGFKKVEVIDEDTGRTGSGAKDRPGFGRLLAEICSGKAGVVLSLEASRLARNNRDWHHLIDLCGMTDTLVMDYEGVYDPAKPNDRLLLGLKGTMSEFELDILRQRAQEALNQKIHRGEVLTQVSIGYVRTEDNGIEMVPDLQVQNAIYGIFSKFDELGSVRQVLLWYREQNIPVPTWSEKSSNREIIWRLPGYNRLLSILKNPVYTGAFVYGRRNTRSTIVNGRARKTHGHNLPRKDWKVLIRDHHAGYISWDKFLKNQKQIEANAGMQAKMSTGQVGAAKSGPALLAGLLRCGRCGRKLHVGYSGKKGRVPRYFCRGAHINHGTEWCISFGGLRVDEAVAAELLDALQPIGIQAALEACARMKEEKDQKLRSLKLALEKAQYEAGRIRRQYDAADPENRLVAGELENRWEEALLEVRELEARISIVEQNNEYLTESQRDKLLQLGQNVRTAWDDKAASATLKKRILRTVIKEIVVDVLQEPARIKMILHWAGGTHTELTIRKNATGKHRNCVDREVVDVVQELVKVCDDGAIAAILNKLGYKTGAGNNWTQSRVRALRSYHKIKTRCSTEAKTWVTLAQAANELKISTHAVRNLLSKGILPGKQAVRYAPWVIQRDDLALRAVQNAVKAIRNGRKVPRIDREDSQVLLFQECRKV